MSKYIRSQVSGNPLLWFSSLSVLPWLLFLSVLLIAHNAQPEMNTGLVRYHQIMIRHDWIAQGLQWAKGLSVLCLFILITNLSVVKRYFYSLKRHQQRSHAPAFGFTNQYILLILVLITLFLLFLM